MMNRNKFYIIESKTTILLLTIKNPKEMKTQKELEKFESFELRNDEMLLVRGGDGEGEEGEGDPIIVPDEL